jgi:hypothetical protein
VLGCLRWRLRRGVGAFLNGLGIVGMSNLSDPILRRDRGEPSNPVDLVGTLGHPQFDGF